jgi:hypothetical protein
VGTERPLTELGLTKKQAKAFGDLTDFVLHAFGVEPTWHVLIEVFDSDEFEEHMGDIQAVTHWPPHYRDAVIKTKSHYVTHLKEWVYILIHEIMHLLVADIHDFVFENTGSIIVGQAHDNLETAISTSANITHSLFIKAYSKELKAWLDPVA